MTILGTIAVKFDALTADFQNAVDGLEKELQQFEKGIRAVGMAATAAFAASAVTVGKFISEASDANEQMNVISTAFGGLTPKAEEWAKAFGNAAGRSKYQMLEMAGNTQAMLVPMVGSTEAAAAMSTKMAQLAVDIGSFNNVTDDEALIALKAGLIGSAEPLRRFGVVMTVAGMEAYALSKGIKASWKDMDEASKVALRYQYIMEQTKLQQGDAAKTAGSFANMVKRIQGQFRDLSVAMGQALLPVAEKVLGVISNVLRVFEAMSPEAKRFTSIAIAIGGALSGITAAVAGLTLALPMLGAAFTTAILPALPVVLSVGAAIGGVILAVGALGNAFKHMGGIKGVVQDLAESIVEWFARAFDAVIPMVEKTMNWVQEKFVMAASFISGASPELAYQTLQEVRKGGGLIAPTLEDFAADVKEGASVAGDALKSVWGDLKAAGTTGVELIAGMFGDAAGAIDTGELESKFGEVNAALSGLGSSVAKKANDIEKEKAQAGENEKGGVGGEVPEMFSGFTDVSSAVGQAISILKDVSPSFNKAMEGLDSAAKSLVLAFEPVVEIASKIVDVFSRAIESVGEFVGAIMKAIGPLLDFAGGVLDAAAGFFSGLGDTFNNLTGRTASVNEQMAEFTEELKAAGGAAARWAEAAERGRAERTGVDSETSALMADLADAQAALRAAQEAFDRAENLGIDTGVFAAQLELARDAVRGHQLTLEELWDSADGVNGGLEDMGDALEKVNEQLLNVPQGFKVFLRRFESIQDDGAVSPFAGIAEPGLSKPDVAAGAIADGTDSFIGESGFMQNVTHNHFESVQVGDPEEFIRTIEEYTESKNSRTTGSFMPTGSIATIPANSFGGG